MTKKPETSEPKADKSSSAAIVFSYYSDLRDKVSNANDTMDKGRERKSELIANAVENKKLHKGAFAWVMRLRKMDPVKRNEFLFHFDVYCDYEKFAREDLLPDRAEPEPEAEVDDDAKDLRPRHLRQPGASVVNIVQDLASKTGAKTSGGDDDPINSVGRGNKSH